MAICVICYAATAHKFGFDRKTMGFLSMITCDVNCNFFAITYRNWISNSFDPDLFFLVDKFIFLSNNLFTSRAGYFEN